MKYCSILITLFLACVHVFAEIDIAEFGVNVNATVINLNDDISKVQLLLGNVKPQEKSFSNIKLQEYKYEGISFFTECSKINDGQIVSIEINAKKYKTKKTVAIGDSHVRVLLKYGTPDEEIHNSLFYYNSKFDHMELEFTFDERNCVNAIRFSTGD